MMTDDERARLWSCIHVYMHTCTLHKIVLHENANARWAVERVVESIGKRMAEGARAGVIGGMDQWTHQCPACGTETRDSTAGCDHCGMEDK